MSLASVFISKNMVIRKKILNFEPIFALANHNIQKTNYDETIISMLITVFLLLTHEWSGTL